MNARPMPVDNAAPPVSPVSAVPVSPRHTTVEVITRPHVFAGMREEWNELLSASACDGLFLTWEWLHSWWRYLGGTRTLFIIAVRAGGRLVALAPLAVRPTALRSMPPLRCLEMLGSGVAGSDHLDVLVRTGWEVEAQRALGSALTGAGEMLALRRMRSGDTFTTSLAESLGALGWRVEQAEDEVCPFLTRPAGGFPEYLASLGAEHRYSFRRKLQALAKRHEMSFEVARTEAERASWLQVLIDLHEKRWRGRGQSEAFNTPDLRAFHDEFSALALGRGWLRLLVLRVDGAPAAALYGVRYGRVFSFYQSGFDPVWGKQSVGLITMGLAIERAFNEGAEEYDLLHGEESYKYHWASQSRRLQRLDIFPPGTRGLVCRGVSALAQNARAVRRRWLRKPAVPATPGSSRPDGRDSRAGAP